MVLVLTLGMVVIAGIVVWELLDARRRRRLERRRVSACTDRICRAGIAKCWRCRAGQPRRGPLTRRP